MSSIGDKFQQETKYETSRMARHRLLWGAKPALYKEYPKAQKIELASFEPSQPMSLDQALRQRKSIRDFQAKPISKEQLSYLLWASTGIQRIENEYEFGFPQSGGLRTALSAGAFYPIETYLIANDVRKLEASVYHYSIKAHQLEQLTQGKLRQEIANAALGQGMCATAAAGRLFLNGANGSMASGRTDIFILMPVILLRT